MKLLVASIALLIGPSLVGVQPPLAFANSISPTTLPSGQVGVGYFPQTLTYDNCGGSCTYSVSVGSLPAGLTLTASSPSTAVLSGTPTVHATTSFTIHADNHDGSTADRAFSMFIANASLITLGPSTLPDGQVRVPYNQTTLSPGGGADCFVCVFGVTSGTLPAGLALTTTSASCGCTALLGGTPTVAGSFTFTITVTDCCGSGGNRTYSGVIIAPGATTTTLAPLSDATVGQTVTFSATVAPSAATGTVTFKDGGVALSAPRTLVAGVATFSTSALTAGTHSITAIYAGDSNNTTSTSPALTQTVAAATTTTTLAPLVGSVLGGVVNFSATVAPSGATGTVTFKDGETTLGTGTLVSGVATFSTTALIAGSHSITAVYAGDSSNATSASAAVVVVITAVPTSTPTPTAVLTSTPIPASGGGGGGGGGGSKAAPPAVPVPNNPDGAGGGGGALVPVGAAPAAAIGGVSAPVSPPAASARAPVSAPPAAPVVVPDTTTRFTAPLAPSGASADTSVLDRVVVQPIHPSDFLAQIPAGMRIEITAADQALPADVSQAQLGSLGGGNAVRLAPPVDLQLHARDIASSAEVPLPDGTLAQTYGVSLPVIAEPTNANETFTWLVGVQEDGHFLGYMRYPSTFDPQTNSLNFELTGQGLQTITVLPVIIQPSKVQTFETNVHTFSSPFKDGVDFGVLGPVWNAYDVLAPQVGGRIGILSPDGSGMIWIDASGVGPAGNGAADNPPTGAPAGTVTPAAVAVVEADGAIAP